jgi:hypothetical protein
VRSRIDDLGRKPPTRRSLSQDVELGVGGTAEFYFVRDAMTANLPIPQRDQTFESICAGIWAVNVNLSWPEAKHLLFGGIRCDPSTPHLGHLEGIFKRLKEIGYEDFLHVLEDHSYGALDKAFQPPARYELRKYYWNFYSFFNFAPLVRKTKFYCPTCIVEDTERLGFAYTHRSHQIIASVVCHKHGDPIGYLSSNRQSKLAERGHLIHKNSDGLTWQLGPKPCPSAVKDGYHILAKFIAAALHGELPVTSFRRRIALISRQLIGDRSLIDRRNRQALINSLRSRIADRFDPDFFPQLPIKTSFFPACDSVNVLREMKSLQANPLCNLLLLSCSFDTPEAFALAAASSSY